MRNLVVIVAAASFALVACADREEVAAGERTYQGKRDAHSWDNAPEERNTLEARLKQRQLAQDEQRRISR